MAAHLSERYVVDVIHSGQGYTLDGLSTAFKVNLSRVHERIVSNCLGSFSPPGLKLGLLREQLRFDRELTKPYDLFIYSGHGVPPFCASKRGMMYCHFPFESHPNHDLPRRNGWQERSAVDRWVRSLGYTMLWNRRMRGYQTVLGNSRFTAGWIERLWKKPVEVLYPPVAIEASAVEKENVIVSLGRFIVTDGKNHALQIDTFRKFLSRTGGDWRLYLMGFCTDFPQDRTYLEKLRSDSKDLPVTFVVNASREAVWSQLARAKVYWHATALGGETHVPPERMEHFGIATAEAMGAGCVPVVPMSGGQPEIVEHEISGFLCRDADALVQFTSRLAGDDHLCLRMGRAARERSKLFRPDAFKQRLSQLVAESLFNDHSPAGSPSEPSRPSLAHDR